MEKKYWEIDCYSMDVWDEWKYIRDAALNDRIDQRKWMKWMCLLQKAYGNDMGLNFFFPWNRKNAGGVWMLGSVSVVADHEKETAKIIYILDAIECDKKKYKEGETVRMEKIHPKVAMDRTIMQMLRMAYHNMFATPGFPFDKRDVYLDIFHERILYADNVEAMEELKGHLLAGKKDYPKEEQLNRISERLRMGFKDAWLMNRKEVDEAMDKIFPLVEFEQHPGYQQPVPCIRATGELIL